MNIPLGLYSLHLSFQRRIDAYELLESSCLTNQEMETVEKGLYKFDMMWWINRIGYAFFWGLVYRGNLADRSGKHTLSVTRSLFLFYLSFEYLFLGDFLAGSLLWEEYKYIFYKYEPQIRKQKILSNPNFLHK